ncbi:MAG: crotonase/enoyl-CoA hydratase family protein [Gammaproteobacteria bacterium]|nr:crotonase/enoyl-CoA hydratase family protein [Gammaproteobacteria bacterium]
MSVSLRENGTIAPPNLPHLRGAANQHQPSPGRSQPERLFDTYFDKSCGVHWITLKSGRTTRMTYRLVQALRQEQMEMERRIRADLGKGQQNEVRFQVLSSGHPGVFNLGGDLDYISKLIKSRDRESLVEFGRLCIDLVYKNATNYNCPVTTISLVRGTALGGGFEAALSANVLVAERQSKMGLPEVMFNMFPGMGAYQLLTQRLAPVQAQRLIQSGRTYTADELYELGIVDILTEEGKGEQAVWDYIRRHQKQSKGEWGLRRVMLSSGSIRYEELLESIEIWADTALSLDDADLKHMDFLVRAQRTRGIEG